jgi:hypothetical protein
MPAAATGVSIQKTIISCALTTLGWAASFALTWLILAGVSSPNSSTDILMSTIAWGIAGALGGTATALVIRRMNPAIGRNKVLACAAGWSLGLALVWLAGTSFMIGLSSAVGLPTAFLIYSALMALGGGIVTSRIVARAYPAIRLFPALLTVLGWSIGASIAGMISISNIISTRFYTSTRYTSAMAGYLLYGTGWQPWALFGAIFGAIGGGVMFWQLYRASRSAQTGAR